MHGTGSGWTPAGSFGVRIWLCRPFQPEPAARVAHGQRCRQSLCRGRWACGSAPPPGLHHSSGSAPAPPQLLPPLRPHSPLCHIHSSAAPGPPSARQSRDKRPQPAGGGFYRDSGAGLVPAADFSLWHIKSDFPGTATTQPSTFSTAVTNALNACTVLPLSRSRKK